jgi:hypothetical protein
MQAPHNPTNGNHEVSGTWLSGMLLCLALGLESQMRVAQVAFCECRVRCIQETVISPSLRWSTQIETSNGNNQGVSQQSYNQRYPMPYEQAGSDSNLY